MSSPRLFHVSEEEGIKIFEPRFPPSLDSGISDFVVWAIDEQHLPNYLVPRDCPRVTFRVTRQTSAADQRTFSNTSPIGHVVALEDGWRRRVENSRLFVYEFPPEDFEIRLASAGYYVSRKKVVPLSCLVLSDLLKELEKRQAEVRFLPSLWALRDAVVNSTLEFSIIRFKFALPK